MTWEELQKPFTGLHWWYRVSTGKKYSYPFMNQQGKKIYWKVDLSISKQDRVEIECRILNIISSIRFWIIRKKLSKK